MNISYATLAAMQALPQALTSFADASNDATSPFAAIFDNQLSNVFRSSTFGRNMGLADPESAYAMMTTINAKDVLYKAQFYELSEMKTGVDDMREAAQNLEIDASTDNAGIESQLQQFVDSYNGWIKEFGDDMQSGGLLANTQAAQMARRELDQSIEYRFNGAKDGVHGLADLGITIDRTTGLANLDTARLDARLQTNKTGVLDAISEFKEKFAAAATLLNSTGNFMPKQLANLSGAISYIADNEASLQAEFGMGDAAQPTGAVAQALAAYNRIYAS